jgi:hypothetical protein
LALDLESIFKETLSKVKSKLQLWLIEISSQIKSIAAITNPGDESTESNKAFYLLSLMLFVSLIFLAPDKIPQTLTQTETGIFEKAQETIKKLVSSLR